MRLGFLSSTLDFMGRPSKLSRAQVQATALSLLDRKGPSGLTMRALAAELGTGVMTLYNYVSQREELEMLVVEAVIAQAQWPNELHGATWQEEVRAIAKAWWQAVRAHPHAIGLILTRRSRLPAMLDMTEALLSALARSGRADMRLLVAFRALCALIIGAAQAELAGPLSLQAGESAQATIARFQALPIERFPRLIEIAGTAMHSTAEQEFDASLDLLIAGLAASSMPDGPTRAETRSRDR
jgi:AcrR family transcriptional regulator